MATCFPTPIYYIDGMNEIQIKLVFKYFGIPSDSEQSFISHYKSVSPSPVLKALAGISEVCTV